MAVAVGLLLVLGAAAQAADSDEPQPSASASSSPAASGLPMRATARDNGVRVTVELLAPLVAGEPATVHTRVKNARDKAIIWPGVGLTLTAAMTEDHWRLGEPTERLPTSGEPGFPAPKGLKNDLVGETGPEDGVITLGFAFDRYEGLERAGAGDAGTAAWVPPGGVIDFWHVWDGTVSLPESGEGGGLPPSGPVRIVATAVYQLSRDDKTRWTNARLDADVVDGWGDDRLHPLEVVDAALAEPAFAELMEAADLGSGETGRIAYDREADVWRVGSCGFGADGDGDAYWRLATVDPFSGDVLGVVEGFSSDGTCNVGAWPTGPNPGSTSCGDDPLTQGRARGADTMGPCLPPSLRLPRARDAARSARRHHRGGAARHGPRRDRHRGGLGHGRG